MTLVENFTEEDLLNPGEGILKKSSLHKIVADIKNWLSSLYMYIIRWLHDYIIYTFNLNKRINL